MTGGLDDPMGRILSQMPDGMVPDRRQYGDRREFTYTFADRSQVVLTFRPRGESGRGLVLDTVNVED